MPPSTGACASAARPTPSSAAAHQTCRQLIDAGAIGARGRRHRVLHVPGPRALAPESGLLLRGRRRADARHGPVLHHRAGQPDRAGRARRRHRVARPTHSATITSEPLRGQMIAVEVDDPRRRHAGVRQRRGGVDRHQLRRAGASPRADRAVRHRGEPVGARPQPLRRPGANSRAPAGRGSHSRSNTATPTATIAASAWPTWRARMRDGPAAALLGRTGAARARGDGGVRRCRATAAAMSRFTAGRRGLPPLSPTGTRWRGVAMKQALIVWGGWPGHEPEGCARVVADLLRAARLSRCAWPPALQRSPTRT